MEFLGSQWGTQSVYKYYKNDEDPSKLDAIFYFSNTSPAIPLGDLSSPIVPFIHHMPALKGLFLDVSIESNGRIMVIPSAQLN